VWWLEDGINEGTMASACVQGTSAPALDLAGAIVAIAPVRTM
jgi:hypothetical protein